MLIYSYCYTSICLYICAYIYICPINGLFLGNISSGKAVNTERKFLFGIYQIGRDQSFLLQRLVIRPSPLEDFCFVSVSPAMSAGTLFGRVLLRTFVYPPTSLTTSSEPVWLSQAEISWWQPPDSVALQQSYFSLRRCFSAEGFFVFL